MPLFRKKPPKRLPLETQLRTLAANGINLLPGRTIDDLLISFPREVYESLPYNVLLIMLGAEVEDESGRNFTDNVCSFDAECIEDTGDYARKIQRLAEIAGGDLPIENIRDAIDVEAGTARIELTLDGRTHEFEPRFDDDWFDPEVIDWLEQFLTSRGSTRRFFLYDSGDQNIVIICTTPNHIARLSKATGLQFHATG